MKRVNAYLARLSYDRQPATLYEPIQYVLSMGGKRLRPILMMLAYQLYRDDAERILPQACALETYHNFTLLHDDLMDNADVRRGHATVHKRWDANTAILSGDSMLLLAFHRMMQCDEQCLKPVLDVFTTTALEIDEGQQMDMDFETRNDVTTAEYLEMIRLKTSVLLACAVKIGALLAGASAQDAAVLYQFGEKLGLAFQLQDDLLDVYGDPKVFGKAIGGDITSNKKTFMLISAQNRADERQRQELDGWITATTFDRQEKVAAVTRLYDEMNIRQLCEDKISQYFSESAAALARLDVDAARRQALADYVAVLMKREY